MLKKLNKRNLISISLISLALILSALIFWSARLSHLVTTSDVDKAQLDVEPERAIYATQKGLFVSEGEAISELVQFDQLVEFKFPDLIAVENGEVWYWQVSNTGEVVAAENLGNLPDLILAMHVQVIQVGDRGYLAYVIPLRGLRLVTLATQENFLVMDATFFRMFTGNRLIVRDQNVYVPNGEVEGGISLWQVNTATRAGEYITAATLPCGTGPWQVQANVGSLFALSLGSKVCLLDIWTGVANVVEGKWAQQFVNLSVEGELLALEEFEIINELPVSTGRVAIYDVGTRGLIEEVDLSDEPLVQELRGAPGGSLSLIGEVQKVGEEVRLVSRGTERTSKLMISSKNILLIEISDTNFFELSFYRNS